MPISSIIVPAQLAATALVMVASVAAPPASGRILLLPLGAASTGDAVRIARRHDALVLGAGPLAGSIVVDGRRAGLAMQAWRSGVVALRALGGPCGA